MKKYKIPIYHLIFWVAYMFLGSLLEYGQNPDGYAFSLADIFISQFPNICTVYLCIWVCSKYSNPLRPFFLVIGIVFVFIFSFFHWYFVSHYIRPLTSASGLVPAPFNFLHFGASVLWVFIRYSILGFGYYFASNGINREKKLRLMEKEKHEAEYAFLRAQINPHFLHNTLNFFFAKSLPLSEDLANGIMTLSEIMRYSLEIDKDDRMTLVDEEIEHIRNVIKINQLRFNNKLQIHLSIQGEHDAVKIIPLILITIVENILKHGNCTDRLNPVKIELEFNAVRQQLFLETWNLKKNGPVELSSGIGLDNIKKRLVHHYGDNFNLEIIEGATDYALKLSLPVNMARTERWTYNEDGPLFQQLPFQISEPKPYIS